MKRMMQLLVVLLSALAARAETRNSMVGNVDVLAGGQNQIIGAFLLQPGEIVAQQYLIRTTGGVASDVSNIALFSKSGTMLAGPSGAVVFGNTGSAIVTFTDSVAPNQEVSELYIKGMPGGTFLIGGGTIEVVALVRGQTMTVRTPSLTVRMLGTPSPQEVVSGIGATVANVELDAKGSSEDIRVSVLPLQFTTEKSSAINSVSLFDQDTLLTSGSNRVEPTGNGVYKFIFDEPLVVAKGTTKRLAVRCVIQTTDTPYKFSWGLPVYENVLGVGAVSSSAVQVKSEPAVGNDMTVVGHGTLSVRQSPESPTQVAIGKDRVIMATNLRPIHEALQVTQINMEVVWTGTRNQTVPAKIIIGGGAPVYGLAFGTLGMTFSQGSPVLPKDTDTILQVIFEELSSDIGDRVQIKNIQITGIGLQSGTTIVTTLAELPPVTVLGPKPAVIKSVNFVPNQPSSTVGVVVTEPGTFTFTATGEPNGVYTVEQSTDLSLWVSIHSSVALSDSAGNITASVTVPVVGEKRFFRLQAEDASLRLYKQEQNGIRPLTSGNLVLYSLSVENTGTSDVSAGVITFKVVSEKAEVRNFSLYAYSDPTLTQGAGTEPDGRVGEVISTIPSEGVTMDARKVFIPGGQKRYVVLRGDVSVTGPGASIAAVVIGPSPLEYILQPQTLF